MVEIILLLAGISILLTILLLLPSVFSKKLTVVLVLIASLYFYTGIILLDYFHWGYVAGGIGVLIVTTSWIVAYLLDKQGNKSA
ncbi:hypothetical protein [Evansella clarkii]|uniref:hypothetical protein n=1 Tax=Evansella clarkii TaxID=79879 RepID=UPI000B432B19|nr:hypothetical protein [Evansella clarkii]